MRQLTAMAGAALMALTITACSPAPDDESVLDDADPRTDEVVGTAGDEDMPRVADLVSNPDRYAGRTVTVEADVEEVFGPMAFALDEDSPLAGGIDNDLLVLSREASKLEAIDDQWMDNKVRVTGTVGTMAVVEVEREVGWDLDPQLEAELEERTAVLIADSVTRIED